MTVNKGSASYTVIYAEGRRRFTSKSEAQEFSDQVGGVIFPVVSTSDTHPGLAVDLIVALDLGDLT